MEFIGKDYQVRVYCNIIQHWRVLISTIHLALNNPFMLAQWFWPMARQDTKCASQQWATKCFGFKLRRQRFSLEGPYQDSSSALSNGNIGHSCFKSLLEPRPKKRVWFEEQEGIHRALYGRLEHDRMPSHARIRQFAFISYLSAIDLPCGNRWCTSYPVKLWWISHWQPRLREILLQIGTPNLFDSQHFIRDHTDRAHIESSPISSMYGIYNYISTFWWL